VSINLRWWGMLLSAVVLPFALVVSAYEAAFLVPGTVRLSLWEAVASAIFVLAVVAVVFLLLRSRLHWVFRLLLGGFAGSILLFSAFIVHVNSTCESLPSFVGEPAHKEVVASCK
jgi:hypothetical protein